MEAELEAAIAADAAGDDQQSAAPYGASPHESPRGRQGPMLELPGDGEGIDFDAIDMAAPLEVLATPNQAGLTACHHHIHALIISCAG